MKAVSSFLWPYFEIPRSEDIVQPHTSCSRGSHSSKACWLRNVLDGKHDMSLEREEKDCFLVPKLDALHKAGHATVLGHWAEVP